MIHFIIQFFKMALFIGWLVYILATNGYTSLIAKIGNEQIHNLYYAYEAANRLNIDAEKFVLLQICESRGITNAKGDYESETGKYLANGVYQFHRRTFDKYSELYNWKGNYFDSENQTDLAAFMLSKEEKNWNHWLNCYKKIK